MLHGQRSFTEREPGSPDHRFDAGGNNKRQRTFVMNRNPRVFDAEFVERGAGLLQNRVPIVRSDPRFE
jgi:hypothetical protein